MRNKEEKTMLEVMEPDYMAEFSCDGLTCPDTCCSGWDIVIDEKTCERYKKSHNGAFKDMLSSAIVHRKEEVDGEARDVACIRMGKGNRCLFLCNDGLCMIQRKTEEKNLSETCRTYPRVIYLWNESYVRRALCVSCPTTANLILNRKDSIHFIKRKIESTEIAGLRLTAQGEHLTSECFAFRDFLIRILQNRKVDLTERLQIANDFFWQAGNLSGHHIEKKFRQICAVFENRIDEAQTHVNLQLVQKNMRQVARKRLKVVQLLFLQRLQNPELRQSFRYQLESVLKHWEIDANQSISSKSIAKYIEERELYHVFFLEEHDEMLENYLVNGVFKNVFLTSDGTPFYLEWFKILVQFITARALLMVALAEKAAPLSTAEAIEIIRQTSRSVGHDTLYMQQAEHKIWTDGDEETAIHDFCDTMLCYDRKEKVEESMQTFSCN